MLHQAKCGSRHNIQCFTTGFHLAMKSLTECLYVFNRGCRLHSLCLFVCPMLRKKMVATGTNVKKKKSHQLDGLFHSEALCAFSGEI